MDAVNLLLLVESKHLRGSDANKSSVGVILSGESSELSSQKKASIVLAFFANGMFHH
jgi:hypothetical protein